MAAEISSIHAEVPVAALRDVVAEAAEAAEEGAVGVVGARL